MSWESAEARTPGLAAERTDLAWNRSGLSLLACAAAILHGVARPPLNTGNLAVGIFVFGLCAVIWALGMRHTRRARTRPDRRATAADLLPISLGVAVVGLAALFLGAFLPS